ncbi:MAG: hypothetical protein H0W74_09050 [Sphingosinicella sp.]|nr:hypothetical protein [Sphingosinicella sp.]
MRIAGSVAALSLLFTGCGRGDEAGDDATAAGTKVQTDGRTVTVPHQRASDSWDLQSSGEGVALVYSKSGNIAVRLFCPSGGSELLVNVPAFRPVASEERLSFGSGGEAAALVADTSGDRQRGGVSGAGAVPENLPALVGGPITVNYGYQNSGPHVAPSSEFARAFAAACLGGTTPPPRQPPPLGEVSACLKQDGQRLQNPALRAVGTEPFWGAQIEGRCVTYSHPEDQDGTRVWTRFTPAPNGGGTWSGSLGGRHFELIVRSEPGCSDGMSDRRYPYAAEVAVNGERRRGCAQLR